MNFDIFVWLSSNIEENSDLINENTIIDSIDFNDIMILVKKLKQVYQEYSIEQKKFWMQRLTLEWFLINSANSKQMTKNIKRNHSKKTLKECNVRWHIRYCYFLIGLNTFAQKFPNFKDVSLDIWKIEEKFSLNKKEFRKAENENQIQFWKEN